MDFFLSKSIVIKLIIQMKTSSVFCCFLILFFFTFYFIFLNMISYFLGAELVPYLVDGLLARGEAAAADSGGKPYLNRLAGW